MVCDYYVQSELVIEYIDRHSRTCKTRTNRILVEYYINHVPEYDTDDDEETQNKKYKKEIENLIVKNTCRKILYETECWIKKSYEKKYYKHLPGLCPGIVKILTIYKDYTAWTHS